MHRSTATLLTALVVLPALLSYARDASALNLLANADMEDCPALPHNTPPAGWGNSSTSAGADCNYWATGNDPGLYAGARSPRLQLGYLEGITQTVTTSPGQTYWVSFYVAGNGGAAEIRFDSYSGALIGSAPITSSYTQITGSFVAAAAMTTIYIGADLTSAASGDARIDEACVATNPAQCGAVAPACGDSNVDPGEACDDGNNADGDGCNATCTSNETCGNGIVDAAAGEACDDGNNADGDGCNAACTSNETCGNGIVDTAAGEACDDGNNVNGDGCNAACTSNETCGNGVVDPGETCDDGNNADGDGCNAACSSKEICGNGIVDPGETCDDGNNIDGDGCNAACTSNETCGNGVVDPGEICDDSNNVDGDGCNAACSSKETCGNGVIDIAAGEACDDGNHVDGDGCQANCALPSCGDGILDVGEVCDDANNQSGDGCNAMCTSDESCGNGILDVAAGEACDDANTVDGDGCQSNCALPSCGDGVLDAAEACDDGNNQSGDGCSATCISKESCGNGILDVAAGEACDDANTVDGDGCQSNCTLPTSVDIPERPVQEGSCGCRLADTSSSSPRGFVVAMGLLGLAGLVRRRTTAKLRGKIA